MALLGFPSSATRQEQQWELRTSSVVLGSVIHISRFSMKFFFDSGEYARMRSPACAGLAAEPSAQILLASWRRGW
jgi:hypothetical protein